MSGINQVSPALEDRTSNEDTPVVRAKTLFPPRWHWKNLHTATFSHGSALEVDGFCREEDGIWLLRALKQTCACNQAEPDPVLACKPEQRKKERSEEEKKKGL